jgi:hypothetical protein
MSVVAPLPYVAPRPSPSEPPTRPDSYTADPHAPAPHVVDPLRRLDRAVNTWFGADLRLLYGLGTPILLIVAAMLPLLFHPSYWLVGALLVLVIACTGFIVTKVMAMLDAPEDATTVAGPTQR